MERTNEFGQPIGRDLGDWPGAEFPRAEAVDGDHVRLEPLDSRTHAGPLFRAFRDAPGSLWTYLPYGPFPTIADLESMIDSFRDKPDWQPYAMVVGSETLGFASFLRIDPPGGVIEIGAITLSPAMQRTTAATETLHLMIGHAFDLGYRRVEWKCDGLNGPSRSAAARLGFRYEGTFRNATHYRGRSRDTAWFAITVEDWADLASSFHAWLSADNFDTEGRQLRTLTEFRSEI